MNLTQLQTGKIQKAHALLKKKNVGQVENRPSPPVTKEVAPKETFTPTADPTPVARQEPAVEVKQPKADPKPQELPKPRSGSDMAIMLENIENAKVNGGEIHANPNGSLALLEDQSLHAQLFPDQATSKSEPHEEHGHGHGPNHGHNAAMAGHLKTEIVEKVGHHAHHAASHGAGHAVSEGKAHAANALAEAHGNAAQNSLGEMAGEVVQQKSHVAAELTDEAAHHASEATAQKAAHAGHSVAEASAQKAAHAAELKSELVTSLAEVKAGASASHAEQVVQQAGHGAAEATAGHGAHGAEAVHEAGSEAAKHGSEVAGHLSTGLTAALAGSAAISGGIGGYMLYEGGKELAHGIKEKDGEKLVEGVAGLAVGGRSLAAGTVMASMATNSSTLATVAGAAADTLTPLGIVHGAADVGLGLNDMTGGKLGEAVKTGLRKMKIVDLKPRDPDKPVDKLGGAIKTAFGATVIAGAVVGGIPLTVASLGLLGVKVGRDIYKGRQAAKQAEAQHSQAQQPQSQPETKDA